MANDKYYFTNYTGQNIENLLDWLSTYKDSIVLKDGSVQFNGVIYNDVHGMSLVGTQGIVGMRASNADKENLGQFNIFNEGAGKAVQMFAKGSNGYYGIKVNENGMHYIHPNNGSQTTTNFNDIFVTTNTNQTISGAKTFINDITVGDVENNYLSIYNREGEYCLKKDGTCYLLPSIDSENTHLAVTEDLTGFVTGPSSATDNSIALFDGTTGKVIKSASNITIDNFTISILPVLSSTGSLGNATKKWGFIHTQSINIYSRINQNTNNKGLVVPDTTEWVDNKTIATLEDLSSKANDSEVVHLGTQAIPSNETIYGEKTFSKSNGSGTSSYYITETTIDGEGITIDGRRSTTGGLVNGKGTVRVYSTGADSGVFVHNHLNSIGLAIDDGDDVIFVKNHNNNFYQYLLPYKSGTVALTDDLTNFVIGPSSATNNTIAVFDGTTGKVIKQSSMLSQPLRAGDLCLETMPDHLGIYTDVISMPHGIVLGKQGIFPTSQYSDILEITNAYGNPVDDKNQFKAIQRANDGTVKSQLVFPLKGTSSNPATLATTDDCGTKLYRHEIQFKTTIGDTPTEVTNRLYLITADSTSFASNDLYYAVNIYKYGSNSGNDNPRKILCIEGQSIHDRWSNPNSAHTGYSGATEGNFKISEFVTFSFSYPGGTIKLQFYGPDTINLSNGNVNARTVLHEVTCTFVSDTVTEL